jgi:ribosomal protein S18 acetylase RimI-like enzyme
MNIIQANHSVIMRRDTLNDVPEYSLRRYQPGDEARWTQIHQLADEYNTFTSETFAQQFGDDEAILRERQYYLCAGDETIGTATAWWNDDFEGERWGQVHWVAVVPQFQGRGLAQPLLAAVCRRLRELGHERAYLGTSTARVAAISLYRKFGFMPHIRSENDAQLWEEVEEFLKR